MPPVPLGVVASALVAKFDPASISGLTMWYDATDATTFTYSSGTAVSQWSNKMAAYERHLTQVTGSYQPDRSGSCNGLTSVKFNQDYLSHTVGSGGWWPFLVDGTNYTLFIAAKVPVGNTYSTLLSAGYVNPGMDTLLVHSAHLARQVISNATVQGGVIQNAANHMYQPGTWFVQSVVTDPDNSNALARSVMRVNGTNVVDVNVTAGAPSTGVNPPGLFLGTRQDADINGVWFPAGSEVGEALIYSGVTLTDAQCKLVNDYLMDRWCPKTTAFVPTDVAGCVHWLDAQDDASFTYSSGTEVSQWNDKSGNNRHFANSTSSQQPTRTVGLNRKQTVSLWGGDALTGLNALPWDTTTQTIDVFVVARRTNQVANYCYVYNNECFGLTFYAASAYYSYARHGISWYPSSWASDNVWHVCEFSWYDSSQVAVLSIDGGMVLSTGASQTLPAGTSPHHVYLGSNQESVQVAEVIAYVTDGGISAVDREKVRAYLSAHWFALPTGVAFDPSTVANLKLWYDMSDVSTLTFSSGTLVSQINDKSGNGRHVSQSDTSMQANFTGTRLWFDGSGNDAYLYAGSSGVNTANVTAFVVAVEGGTGRDQGLFTLCGAGQDFDTPTAIFMNTGCALFRTGVGGSVFPGKPMPLGVYRGVCRSDHTIDAYWNGMQGATGTSSGTYGVAANAVVVGGRWVNGAIHSGTRWIGQLCEILVYDRVLTATECANIESGLRLKWGIPTWV